MKETNKIGYYMKAATVIAVALAFIVPTSAVITNPLVGKTYQQHGMSATQQAIHKSMPSVAGLGTDVLVSGDNPDFRDETPHATMNSKGVIVVVYEKEIDSVVRRIPVVYSNDNGATWITQFELDSTGLQGSDYLQSPDVKYSAVADQLFVHMVDPFADMYNQEFWWIDGDIANDTEATGYGISSQGGSDYTDGAVTYVGEWAVGLAIHTYSTYPHTLGLGYFMYDGVNDPMQPEDYDPTWATGFYYDAWSILKTSEASQPELATGNNLYMVCQSFNGAYSNISFKATVTDLNPASPTFLFTKGGGPSGMDKYADIECWPLKQFYLAVDATDPDVAAKGDVVAVAYDQAGDVKCRTSINAGMNWSDATTVATGSYPAVFVADEKIYVAYVSSGNLFYKVSTDNGATWGAATQVNDVSGTVVAKAGTADIGPAGFVWTDNRDGANNIYHDYMKMDTPAQLPKLEITKIGGGIGVSATIKNTGDAAATNVEWTITVTGGILGLINVEGTGTAATLAVGAEMSGKTKMILGFGAISVQVTATCDEGSTATLSKTGKQLLIFSSIPA